MKKIYFLGLTLLSLSAFAQDPTTAIVPTNSAADVVNVFSETYTPNNRFTNKAVNTSRASASDVVVSGNTVIKFNFKLDNATGAINNYSQSEFAGTNVVDASSMNFFHIDIYNPATGGSIITNLIIKLVDFGADGANGSGPLNADNKEGQVNLATPAPGTWSSYNVPMSSFGTNLLGQRTKIGAMLITSSENTDLYVDNIYFSSTSTYTTLPLTLTSFSGKTGFNGSDLTWTTAAEENFSGFEIQRRSDDSEFSKVAFVAGGKSNYSFTDLSPLSGNNYYRLKMIDNDGTFKYSEVVAVKYGLSSNEISLSIFPNPVTNILNVSFTAQTGGAALATLVDVQGRTVKRESFDANAGTNTATINVADVNSGSYILNVTLNGSLIGTKKIVK